MSRSWQALMETRKHHELSFAERIEPLIQAEQDEKGNKRFERLYRNAHFRYQASVQELTMDASRGLDKSLMSTLATREYTLKGEAILISGASGTGKPFLA